MIARVITIMHNEHSVAAAKKCIESGKKYGIDVEMWRANSPDRVDIHGWFQERRIPSTYFQEEYSRLENCMAAFSSHYSLWEECRRLNKPMLCMEHDAVFVDKLPNVFQGHIINLGKPSYGNYEIPNFVGENKLFSKDYMPGAHAYRITPIGAELLMDGIREAGPTDVYMHKGRFGNQLHEIYPWPIEVKETFTTIQRKMGCYAKHQFNNEYKII